MANDTRIAYGARCVWWDSIDKVGKVMSPRITGHMLPCCPHCRGMLFEMDSPEKWWASVDRHEAKGNPGYRQFVEWLRGRCFPDYPAAKTAYEVREVT